MLKPLFNNILVKPSEKEKQTSGGIYIPDSVTEKPQDGEIVAVGPNTKLKVGQRVIYTKWGGNEVEFEGKDYLIIKDVDILGIRV